MASYEQLAQDAKADVIRCLSVVLPNVRWYRLDTPELEQIARQLGVGTK